MPMTPLNRLRRFAANAPAPKQEPPPTVKAQQPVGKPPAALTLTDEQRKALANPDSHRCKHCRCGYSADNIIFFHQGPTVSGWYCMRCSTHYHKHKVLPDLQAKRVLPKKVTNGT